MNFHQLQPISIRKTSALAYLVAEWYAAGGAYHSYYMWHGGNNYGRTAASGVTTLYADDVCLHADGTPNQLKYTQVSRLQYLIAERAEVILSPDSIRIVIPYWNGILVLHNLFIRIHLRLIFLLVRLLHHSMYFFVIKIFQSMIILFTYMMII
jgi:hypothetical protein